MNLLATKPIEKLLDEAEKTGGMKRRLGALSLVTLGIGAIIGAGIFTLTGVAAATHAGPAMVYSFLLAALGCMFAGICYSEFSTMIPIAGSAYTYSYATMGELVAWVIGWALVLEYAVGAATVSVSWAATLDSILLSFGIEMPRAIVGSPFSAQPGTLNLVAVAIICVVSFILIRGVSESAKFNDFIVILKVTIVIMFIGIGYFFINYKNYHPFLPPNTGEFGSFGWSGVLAAAGQIFFAYIGFDAVSTAAQEAKNAKRDMPIGIIGSLAICTVLYIAYSLVLTGIVNYKDLNVAAPLAMAVDQMKGTAVDRFSDEAGIAVRADVCDAGDVVWTVARFLFDGERRLAAEIVFGAASDLQNAVEIEFVADGFRFTGCVTDSDCEAGQFDEHWHAFCVCRCLYRRHHLAQAAAGYSEAVSDALGAGSADSGRGGESGADGRTGRHYVGGFSDLDGAGADYLFHLQPVSECYPVTGSFWALRHLSCAKKLAARRIEVQFFLGIAQRREIFMRIAPTYLSAAP